MNAPVSAASRTYMRELDSAWHGLVMFPPSEVLLAIHLVLPFTKHQAFIKAGQAHPFSVMTLIPALRGTHIALHYWYTRAIAGCHRQFPPPSHTRKLTKMLVAPRASSDDNWTSLLVDISIGMQACFIRSTGAGWPSGLEHWSRLLRSAGCVSIPVAARSCDPPYCRALVNVTSDLCAVEIVYIVWLNK